jgi:hypothetical protein
MADIFVENPWLMVVMIIGVIGAAVYFLTKKRDLVMKFNPNQSAETISTAMKKKLSELGTPIKATLNIGLTTVAKIDRYKYVSGNFDSIVFDANKREYKKSKVDQPVNYDFLLLRSKSNNLLMRLLGMKKKFWVLDLEKKDFCKYDSQARRFILPTIADITSHNDVWVTSDKGMEFLQNISYGKLIMVISSMLEVWPEKLAHLEASQAKRERIDRVTSDLERNKWEAKKNAGDTTIS